MDIKKTEQLLLLKANEYKSKFNIEATDTEVVEAIHYLLNQTPENVGGITALRGFVYQYYVAMYYMVEMLYEKNSWWDNVVFEILDDIALIGKDQIRFIQVKTVREDGEDRHLTAKHLYERKDELNSWLDKLFYNMQKFNKDEIGINISKDMQFQFELATNATYEKEGLGIYAKNDFYKIEDKILTDKDILLSKLNKELVKSSTKKSNSRIVLNFNERVGQEPKWCLERFYLNHFGSIESLKNKIIGKLSDYCRRSMVEEILSEKKSLNINPNNNPLFTEISSRVLQNMLVTIVEKTHKDHLPDKYSFVFSRKEFENLVNVWTKHAITNMQLDIQNFNFRELFLSCFQELDSEIDLSCSVLSVKKDLRESITWIYEALENENSKISKFVYEKFLNRLFHLDNSNFPISQKIGDDKFLKDSLKYIVLYLAFYSDREFIFDNNKFLFKKGRSDQEAIWNLFSMYNARGKDTYLQAQKKIISQIENCSFSNSIQEPYHFFITHEDKAANPNNTNPFFINNSITHNYRSEEKEIIDIPIYVKFHEEKDLQAIYELSQSSDETIEFKGDETIKIWHEMLWRE
ncbi:dsDNA nuclease domain-containing protein [Paenibacillus sp. PK4536]|uniref:dsDNA nuclease domain-containing protein n=1 Tax=Paenibacillus sp. PK4536 TaxID=3024576 RepID=UPI0023597764|nr:dsDNA nuclease domain-containing protein [Paenibacillus sp. PK4536]WIM38639.1 dsDNA nuclease domain-containing protein [Paenibacillus sp. PK4536]